MSVKLSQFIETSRDAEIVNLGHAKSRCPYSLAYADSEAYLYFANENKNISAILTSEELAPKVDKAKGLAVVRRPRDAFYKIHSEFIRQNKYKSDRVCGRGENVYVHPSAVVSDQSFLGNNVQIHENVVIKDHVVIGKNTIVDAGSVVGVEGILYSKSEAGIEFIAQAGGVEIGESVRLLANSSVVRSITPFEPTQIGNHSVIGISTTVGHEAIVGNSCVVSGQCVIARAAQIGDEAWIGTNAFIREYIQVGKGSKVGAGSVVVKDVKAGEHVSGNFAIDHRKSLREFAKRC